MNFLHDARIQGLLIETVRKDISKEDWQFEVVTSSKYIVHNEFLWEGKRSK